jgi:co-chaperonin GroES (HSP10)
MKVTGTIKPLGAKVFVSDMEFGEQKSAGGIFIPSANGKAEGITPRWGRVWAIGPEQQDVKVGEWILVEHGRWTRTVKVEQEDGSILEVRMVDTKDVMMSADEKPEDLVYRRLD